MTLAKKALVGVVALSMFALTACGSKPAETTAPANEAAYKDGTYTAVGQGFGGDIEIEVVVKDGKIEALNVLNHSESAGISDPAFEGIESQLLEKQSDEELEIVTGASKTSEGLIAAINEALAQAK